MDYSSISTSYRHYLSNYLGLFFSTREFRDQFLLNNGRHIINFDFFRCKSCVYYGCLLRLGTDSNCNHVLIIIVAAAALR